jgi:hypothetical protein
MGGSQGRDACASVSVPDSAEGGQAAATVPEDEGRQRLHSSREFLDSALWMSVPCLSDTMRHNPWPALVARTQAMVGPGGARGRRCVPRPGEPAGRSATSPGRQYTIARMAAVGPCGPLRATAHTGDHEQVGPAPCAIALVERGLFHKRSQAPEYGS